MEKTIVIVGGVAGGASCAARLRRQDEWSEIILIEKGPFVSFANCGLPYYIGHKIKHEDDLLLADKQLFHERFNIDVRTQHEVISIDPASKSISVKNHASNEIYEQHYDDLVLSPGAKPLVPPLPGVDLPGIFTIRTVPDSNQVKSWINSQSVDSAVIVGGGFIGLEMAENLTERGIKVTLIERSSQIMPVLDPEMTIAILQEMEKNGVNVVLQDSVSSFKKTDYGITVVTERERELHTDMVILAIGVMPDTKLAKDAGIATTERGHIVVNEFLRTSVENIYAVGDAIEVESVVSGQKTVLPLAGPANRQGRIVADVISGKERTFRGVQGTAVCGVFGVTLASTGMPECQLSRTDIDYTAIYAHPNNHVGYYPGATSLNMKLIFEKNTGRILGAQATGENSAERRIDVIAMAIQMGATVFDLEESELCYAPQYGAAKDPVNILGMIGSNVIRGDLEITPWHEIGKDDAIILDVRTYNEIALSPIIHKSAIMHIPLNELRGRLHELDKNVPIQVSCYVGARANNAVRMLKHHGFDASLLPGGTLTLSCLTHCPDGKPKLATIEEKAIDPLEELHNAESPLSSLPLWLLHEMQSDGVLREYTLGQGESISVKAGTEGDTFLLAAGEVDVIELDQVTRQLSSVDNKRRPIRLAGNIGLTLFARSPSTLVRIDQEYIDFYESWYAMLENIAQKRPDLSDILIELRRPSIFLDLPLVNVQEILLRMETIQVDEGTDIITQGDEPDYFYILAEGEAEVWQQDLYDDKPKYVRTLKVGESVGEDAFIMEGTRSATVKITKPSKFLRLAGNDFKLLISQPLDNQVDHSTAKIQIDQGQKELLDVRYEEEWDEERIPKAILIPLPQLRLRLDDLDKSKSYIIYCHAGKRSAVAAMILHQNGFKVSWLTGGIRDWPYAVDAD